MPSSEWLIRVCEHGHRVEWHASYDGWLHMDAETATVCRAGTPSTVAVVAAKASPVIPAPVCGEGLLCGCLDERRALREAIERARAHIAYADTAAAEDTLSAALGEATEMPPKPVIPAPKCETCDGTGKVDPHSFCERSWSGITCPDCHGAGVAEVKAAVLKERIAAALVMLDASRGAFWADCLAATLRGDAASEPVAEVTPTAPSWEVRWSPQALADLAAIVHSSEPVAEVIPVAVLRERRGRAALSIASCERGSDVANEQDRILVAVVLAALLDEHTRTKPRP